MVAKLLCLHESGIRLAIHEPHKKEVPLRVTDFLEYEDKSLLQLEKSVVL